MNLGKFILAGMLVAAPAARATSCIASCFLMMGKTIFTAETYDLIGTGANLDEAMKDLSSQCTAKAQERQARTVRIKMAGKGWNSGFDFAKACSETLPNEAKN